MCESARRAGSVDDPKRSPNSVEDRINPLPNHRDPQDDLTRQEFDQTLRSMSDDKSVGPHGVPKEAYRHCPSIVGDLFSLIDRIWTEEKLSTNFVRTKFIIIFKKGVTKQTNEVSLNRAS